MFGNPSFDPNIWGYTVSALDEDSYTTYKERLEELVTHYGFTYALVAHEATEA